MQTVKAVLFDVFGTLVDWRGSLIADLTRFGRERGITADWPAFADAWRAAYRPSMQRVRSGELAWTILDRLQRISLDRLIAEFGIGVLSEQDRQHINRLWHRLRPWPDTVEGLLQIKRSYIIGPLSNGNVALLVNMAKAANLPWDVIFGSDLFRHYKPDPEVYLGACALLDLPPGEVMLVAAHNDDLAAARRLGLRTGFIPRPQEYGPNQKRDLQAEEAWDVIAPDVIALAQALAQHQKA
jgi:2-haloacid dehalogenase